MAIYSPKKGRNQQGFSLIEIIMVLILLSILGLVGSLGITSFVKTYVTTKKSNEMISDGQIALLRIAKELIALNVLDTGYSNLNQLGFSTIHNDNSFTYKIYLSSGELHLEELAPETHNDILAKSVESLNFTYYVWDSDNSTNPFQQAANPTWTADRCTITIQKSEYKSSDNKIKFEFSPTTYGHFNIMYDNNSSTVTTTDSSKEKAEITTVGATLCDYAYIYAPGRAGEPMCFFKIPVTGDPFTSKTDSSCYQLPAMSAISGRTVTRIIKIDLKMAEISPLSIMVIPRNIY